MVDPELLSQLIGDIYDAALDPSLWVGVLEQATQFIGGTAAGIYWKDITVQGELHYVFNVEPSSVDAYFDKYIRLDPSLTAQFFFKVGEIYNTTNVLPYDEFVETTFYKEWVKPNGWADHLAATLDKTATCFAQFGVFRSERQGLADDNMRQRMHLLVPHVRRAVLIGNVIDLQKEKAGSLSDALDGLHASVFLLDKHCHIAFSNIAAQTLLDDATILRTVKNNLIAVDPHAAQVLRNVVAAASDGDGAVGADGVAIPLSSKPGQNWVADILPLTSGVRRQAGGLHSAVAAVFIRKVSMAAPYPTEVAARQFQLTPSEVRVLDAMLKVSGVSEIAEALGIGESTVKTHLQNIFGKTGARRQADLIKLVAALARPFPE
ncbi:helix-turn-helix transcriptional regulator [Bradyrhizobium canariense]|uniref:helix-turn-helix transcriptional regulator n=1 Tax=Bradyrhizobium canariense TaxID=255045 RepID=UPI001B8A242E|nr:helix-turn-helix transcriptional regulator [Bradyrhizobium canariense]MBR0954282.1 helix-turn-helix transcriptional regulator [Bradyrhizobium canariense]